MSELEDEASVSVTNPNKARVIFIIPTLNQSFDATSKCFSALHSGYLVKKWVSMTVNGKKNEK